MVNKRILVIDDEPTFSDMVKLRLEDNGYRVDVACGGQEGLTMLDKKKYSLVLLDLMMPGMNGFEMLELIGRHEKNQYTPVVMLTAKGQTKNILKAQQLGAKDYIMKPFDSVALLKTIRRHLV